MLVLAVSIAVEVAWPSTGVEVDNAVWARMVLSGMLAVLSVTLLFADVVNAGVDDVAKTKEDHRGCHIRKSQVQSISDTF